MQRIFLDKVLTKSYFMFFNLAFLLLKVIYSFQNNFNTLFFEDWRIANNIAKHGFYSEFIELGSTAYKLPIYPLFLSIFIGLFPDYSIQAIIIFQHFIYFCIPFLFLAISKIFHQEKIGILTAYFFIFSPAYFYYSNVLEVTNVFIVLLLLWVFVFVKIYKGLYNTYLHYSIFALITALVFLTQVVAVPIIILLVIYLLYARKLQLKNWIFVVVLSVLLYSPWVIRNYTVFDRFIPTKTPVWQNIYLSYTPAVNVLDAVNLFSEEHERKTFQLRKHTSEFEMEKIYKKETLQALDGKPEVPFVKMAQNVALLWFVPSRYYFDNSLTIVLGRKVFILFFNGLLLCSIFTLYRKNKKLFFLSILVFLNFTIPYTIGHAANTRFKLDFEWYQYFLSAWWIMEIIKRKTTRIDPILTND